jgi:hypothetical protein
VKDRIHAAFVIASRQALETFLAPAFYVTLAIGMALGYFTVSSFTRAIDSSGFNAQLNPAFELVTRFLGGAFGSALVTKLFAEGPFVLALIVSLAPLFIYLAIASVFRFGAEKTSGGVEMFAYGPADGTSYLVATFLKDSLFILLALVVVSGFLAVAAGIDNLVLGPLFFSVLPLVFLLSLAVFAYGALSSILTSNASSAVAVFLSILVLFVLLVAGSLMIASDSVRTVSSVAAAILQWISPFFYAQLCLRSLSAGNAAGFLGGLALLLVLTAAVLAVSHLVIRRRGVRA